MCLTSAAAAVANPPPQSPKSCLRGAFPQLLGPAAADRDTVAAAGAHATATVVAGGLRELTRNPRLAARWRPATVVSLRHTISPVGRVPPTGGDGHTPLPSTHPRSLPAPPVLSRCSLWAYTQSTSRYTLRPSCSVEAHQPGAAPPPGRAAVADRRRGPPPRWHLLRGPDGVPGCGWGKFGKPHCPISPPPFLLSFSSHASRREVQAMLGQDPI